MVSIRRRRYLGLCSGKGSFSLVLPKPIENVNAVVNPSQHVKPVNVHPMPPVVTSLQELQKQVNKSETYPGSSNGLVSSTSKNESNNYYPGKEIKRRKRHRRKHYEDQEACIMRGVYFKNMKWQAAIKVDKRQIHLGTVGSQEEAARLYDRAAFMCGREPNFDLSEEDKQELKQYSWEEFLAMTRSAINNKKSHRIGLGRRKNSETLMLYNNWEHEGGNPAGSSISEDDEDVDADTSAS